MSYFSELDLMRGAPCLLDEIAALRGEDEDGDAERYPPKHFCPTCGWLMRYHGPAGRCLRECPSCHGDGNGPNGYACSRCKGVGCVPK